MNSDKESTDGSQIAETKDKPEETTPYVSKEYPIKPLPNPLLASLPFYSLTVMELVYLFALVYLKNPFVYYLLFWGLARLLDSYLPEDCFNYSREDQAKARRKNIYFQTPLCTGIIVYLVIHYYVIMEFLNPERGLVYKLVMILGSAELTCLISETLHELGHQHNKFAKFLTWFAFTHTLYAYFTIDHNEGHHVDSNTPKDSFYCPKGTHFYDYVVPSLWKEYLNSWRICIRTAGGEMWTFKNRMIRNHLTDACFLLFITYAFGANALWIILIFCIYVRIYNSMLNYFSHYGLCRKEISPGEYEPQNHRHSWNSMATFSNFIIFKSQRHSDHHIRVHRPYQCYTLEKEAPIAPGSILLNNTEMFLFPEKFMKNMDRIVDEYNSGKDVDPYSYGGDFESELKYTWKVVYLALGLTVSYSTLVIFGLSI